MNIALLSPYHSGSHQAWAEGVARHSNHDVRLVTLPGRFWKWRMHGGAVTLARQFLALDIKPDLIVTDGMLDATTFLALTRTTTYNLPFILYMHENQLTYPLHHDKTQSAMQRQHGEWDRHYIFINYTSMMAADHICFNSEYHHDAWFSALPNFLKHFPDHNELDSIETLKNKSSVLPIGITLNRARETMHRLPTDAPLILWNQRWEYDKNPDRFFAALQAVSDLPFQVAVCGENFRRHPTVFDTVREWLGERIIHWGYAESEQYRALLNTADIVISTAYHEFFGISIVEAVAHGAYPLLPNHLSYPELIPQPFHDCLYEDENALLQKLRWALGNVDEVREIGRAIAPTMNRFSWDVLAPHYDAVFTNTVAANG